MWQTSDVDVIYVTVCCIVLWKDSNMADLSKGVKYIKRFVKKAQRDCWDKNNRGFADEITLINETLDELEEVVKYVDHLQLKFYKSNKKG